MNRDVMKKALLGVMILGYGVILSTGESSSSSAVLRADDAPVTFSNQVVRIFQKNCQICHHPGDIAPFSLMTYEDAYPWAPTIKSVTQSRRMPPWKLVEGCGEFQNKRGLTDEEIAAIARWVDAGAPEGDPADTPPWLEFPDGWTLGEPDMVVTPEVEYMPDPTGGEVYRCFSISTNLTQGRYVTKMEIRPGHRNIVHHVLLFIDTTGESAALDEADPGPSIIK
ncbi:MAG: cytochrome c [Acidobacteria bacterium]|nr:cytochrome c [Acidobacteriota bacterium]